MPNKILSFSLSRKSRLDPTKAARSSQSIRTKVKNNNKAQTPESSCCTFELGLLIESPKFKKSLI